MKLASRSNKALLLLTGAFQLGGGIAAANRLVYAALQDAGYAIDIYALNETDSSRGNSTSSYCSFANSKLRFTVAVWKTLFSCRYEFVFCDHVNLASILLPLKMLTKQPVVVRLNGIEVFPPNPSFEGRLGLRAATHLTAISDFTKTQVVNQFPALTVTTIDLSLPPSVGELSAPPSILDSELKFRAVDGSERALHTRYILHIGRMASGEQYKGQDTLIRAMPLILEKHPEAQLVLVGQGDDRDRLLALAKEQDLKTQKSVFFPGFVEQDILEALYAGCYVFAMPSSGEGFGLVYLEAMRWARACLGSYVDAAATVIVDGETGVLVSDPTDPQLVASAINGLMDEPDVVRQMGQKGLERLIQRYLFEHFSQRFLDWLEQSVCSSTVK